MTMIIICDIIFICIAIVLLVSITVSVRRDYEERYKLIIVIKLLKTYGPEHKKVKKFVNKFKDDGKFIRRVDTLTELFK